MAENMNQVLIGARGWLHPGWQGHFYPDDLPPDWQLAYYANEFSMVVIREQEWEQLENIATLREDCAEDFRFVVELPLSLSEEKLSTYIERLRQLGKQCAGVIVHADQASACTFLPAAIPRYIEGSSLVKIQTGASLKALRALMERALQMQASSPVLFVVEGEPPDVELLRNAQIMFELL